MDRITKKAYAMHHERRMVLMYDYKYFRKVDSIRDRFLAIYADAGDDYDLFYSIITRRVDLGLKLGSLYKLVYEN